MILRPFFVFCFLIERQPFQGWKVGGNAYALAVRLAIDDKVQVLCQARERKGLL